MKIFLIYLGINVAVVLTVLIIYTFRQIRQWINEENSKIIKS
jgi:hypothetical protein